MRDVDDHKNNDSSSPEGRRFIRLFEMYNPEYVKEKEMLSRAYEAFISAAREYGASDEQIAQSLVRKFGITPQYAKNLVECDYNDENEVMAV